MAAVRHVHLECSDSGLCFHKTPNSICPNLQLRGLCPGPWRPALAASRAETPTAFSLVQSVLPSHLIFPRLFNRNPSRLINDRYEQQLLHANRAGCFI